MFRSALLKSTGTDSNGAACLAEASVKAMCSLHRLINWPKQEFGDALLGDARLSERLVEIAQSKAEKPGCAYTGVAEGDWPAVKAYYRFIDHPDEEAVNMAHILEPHRKRTIQRMKAQRTVLCIQDGSDLDYTSLAECEGLGVIGTNQTEARSRG